MEVAISSRNRQGVITYRIESYKPCNEGAVASLQQLLWQGGLRRNAAYLDWKYYQNPYLDHRYIMLAWAGPELVGMVGAFGAYWEGRNRSRLMLPCLADTVVAPGHQGGPLFGYMLDEIVARLRVDGIPWILDFGDQPAGPAMLMRGWKAIGPWPIAVARRQGPVAMERAWLRPNGFLLRGSRSKIAIQITQTTPASSLAGMAALVAQLPAGNRVRHVRDRKYFIWRSRNPLAHYFYLTAGSQKMEGYLVAHRGRVDPNPKMQATPTTITECEAATDDLWMDLLEVALSCLPGSVVLMWARDTSPTRLNELRSVGFELDQPTGRLTQDWHLPNLLVRSTGVPSVSPFANLDASSAWDLRAVCGRSWR